MEIRVTLRIAGAGWLYVMFWQFCKTSSDFIAVLLLLPSALWGIWMAKDPCFQIHDDNIFSFIVETTLKKQTCSSMTLESCVYELVRQTFTKLGVTGKHVWFLSIVSSK